MGNFAKSMIPQMVILAQLFCIINAVVRHHKYTETDICDFVTYGEEFLTLSVPKSSRCAFQCTVSERCTSFLFDPATGSCRLNVFRNPAPYLNNTCRPIKYWEIDLTQGEVAGCTAMKENIRLCDGDGPGLVNQTMGRLEVFWNRNWGSVCDDYWDDSHYTDVLNLYGDENAVVVCRTLGYSTGISRPDSHFTVQTWPFPQWFDNVKCTGTEEHIFECPMNTQGENCNHSEDVGVECFP